jgi:cytidylate kinase
VSLNNVIITGPQGCGKTRNGEALRVHFGMRRVVDGDVFFDDTTRALNGNLILINETNEHYDWSVIGRVVKFEDAMKEARLS